MTQPARAHSIIILGHDDLALLVCEELRSASGFDTVLLWDDDQALAERAAAAGARFVAHRPDRPDALAAAGIDTARTIIALSSDDRLNLQVALRARDHNPDIRIVLRQFNRTLGRRVEQNLANCAVLSLSAYSAATFASAAVDPEVFQAVQFPHIDGPLLGFARVPAEEQQRFDGRILSVEETETIVFRRVKPVTAHPGRSKSKSGATAAKRPPPRTLLRAIKRIDPIVRWFVFLTLAVFGIASAYFTVSAHLNPLNAVLLVTEIISTNGPTDIAFKDQGPASLLFAIFLMIAGVALTGFFVALLTSRLTKLQWVTLQGLRPFHKSGHIIICGAGHVGSRVIDYLLDLNQRLLVIELNPRPHIVEASREKRFALFTGDATLDATLELCNIEGARALIALTENDTMNLEVALSARARNPHLQIVMRVVDNLFESSVRSHFGFTTTFAPATLTAPAFGGLAFTDGARGHVSFAGAKYGISETFIGDPLRPIPAGAVPLCVWRSEKVVFIEALSQARPGEMVLYLVPLEVPAESEPVAGPPVSAEEPLPKPDILTGTIAPPKVYRRRTAGYRNGN